MPEINEKRKFRRVPMVALVQTEIGGMPYVAEARNISVGGMLLRTIFTLEEGVSIQLRFVLPDSEQDIAVTAMVQHVSPDAYMGIRFLDLSLEDRARIQAYVDAAHTEA